MTDDPMDRATDKPDPALDALLRQLARPVPPALLGDLEARILAAAAFPLAARRRNARTSVADTLAAWARVALPLAAAAAIAAVAYLSQMETRTLAEAELRESDPAALLSALEADGSSGLAQHLIGSDAVSGSARVSESR
jgi:anti-sigma-K factor RskA